MNMINVKDFSLKHTLDCGQFFLYDCREDNSYKIINGQNKFVIKQDEEKLFFEGINEYELKEFFGLNEDISDLKNEKDEYLLLALENYWGLRLMKTDLWQTIIGFVLSSNSSILRIKKSMKLIVRVFGDDVFPMPGMINDYDKILECGVGYRAKFIFSINQMVKENPNLLNDIENSDYKTAKSLLMQFPGIGPKVADCICLFGLNHKTAFPIDTWVKQIIEVWYLKRSAKNIREIEDYINENFTEGNIGLKQQYLFHYARHHLKS